MRFAPVLVFIAALASCGSPPATSITPPAVTKIEAAIIHEDAITGSDIGAVIIGSTITVPAYHELQVATVVFRDEAYSPAESDVGSFLSNREQHESCRIVAFAPKGPLRPDATDTLIQVNGRTLRWVGDHGAMYGHDGPLTLVPGAPYVRIADLIYGGKGEGGYSSDIHESKNVAFAVHVFVRLVVLTLDDPRYGKMHDVNHGQSSSRTQPIKMIDEIIGADPTAKPQAASGF